MAKYSRENLSIEDDPIGQIRRRADWFVGGTPHGALLAGNLARDLFLQGCVSVHIENIGVWWKVRSNADWLRDSAGGISYEAFSKVLRFPILGPLAIRREIVITALSDAVVTVGSEGVTWIVGDSSRCEIPQEFLQGHDRCDSGRALLFSIGT